MSNFDAALVKQLMTDHITARLDAGVLQGVCAGVWIGGEQVVDVCLGQRDAVNGIPMTRDSLFRLASMTKPVAGCAGMHGMIGGQCIDLINEGKSLDQTILHTMHAKKTGALIRAACVGGTLLGTEDKVYLTAAEEYAKEKGIKLTVIKPEYNKYGRGAPLVRNKEIVDLCDIALIFWNGQSRGTKFVIDYCEKTGKKYKLFTF